jgi:diguanylate cyclase (GGDEF)-like protein
MLRRPRSDDQKMGHQASTREARSRAHRVFAPGRKVLAALGLVQKFTLVLVILAVPLTFISWGYMSGSAHDRTFTEREIAGTDVLIASVDLLVVTVEHRSAPIGAAAIETARARLIAALNDHGDMLGVRDEWATTDFAIKTALGVGRQNSFVRAAAVDSIRRFIVTVGDQSNLTLDPELDTYYLMDASQYRYPALLAIAGEHEFRATVLDAAGTPLPSRWQAVVDLARVMSVELTSLSSGQDTVARETSDRSVQLRAASRADDALTRAGALDRALGGAIGVGWLDTTAALDPTTVLDTVEAQTAALAAMPTTGDLHGDWTANLEELHRLLERRLEGMTSSYHRFLAGAALCLAMAVYLLLSLFSGLLRSLRDIRGVLTRAGGGDLTAMVKPVGSDELAEVSRAINDTVARVAAAQAELERRATHDGLTGLPNREHFVELLEARMAIAPSGAPLALGFVDLDSFKSVNDLHGHHNGDEVLRVVADRLQECTPPGSICARLAGDEYAVLLAPGLSRSVSREVMQQVLRSLSEPIALVDGGGQALIEGASLGLAFYDGTDPLDAEGLLAAADFAMYEAKSTAPGLVREFTVELAAAVRRRSTMRSELTRAMQDPHRWGFSVAYQPIVDLRSNEIVGSEALARWATPTLGRVAPSEFIPLAESIGLISALGQFVLGDAAAQLARGQARRPDLFMSVNVSALALADGHLEAHVDDATRGAGVRPETFWLELTESAMMIDPPGAARRIAAIRRRGHPVAIDDFGTGYSSLSYLHSLELSALKIDRSFVEAIDDPAATSKRHILNMMLELARHLGLDIVAEGIESPRQLDALVDYGVRRGQGFLLHRPMPGPALDQLLIDGGRRAAMTAAP